MVVSDIKVSESQSSFLYKLISFEPCNSLSSLIIIALSQIIFSLILIAGTVPKGFISRKIYLNFHLRDIDHIILYAFH